jgi:hypothetical protein
MNKPTNWIIKLVEADDGSGDLVLPLTDEIMEAANWQPGDTLDWTDNKDGTWTLTKKNKDEPPINPTE